MSVSLGNRDTVADLKAAKSRSFLALDVSRKLSKMRLNASSKSSSDYLPPFAYSYSKRPQVRHVNFSIQRNAVTGKNMFTMQVDWHDAPEVTAANWSQDFSSRPKVDIICDGPCGLTIPDDSNLMQFGICDHNICLDCYRTQRNVELFDGSPGCCNENCVKRYTKERYQMTDPSICRSNRSGSRSDHDIMTGNGVEELYLVKVIIFEKAADKNVVRRIVDRELNSRDRMSSVYGLLRNLIPELDKAKVYCTTLTSFSRKDLIPLEPFSNDRRRLETITGGDDIINILVATKGVSIKQ